MAKKKATKKKTAKKVKPPVDDQQTAFITAKVKELGSYKAVASFYSQDCAVDELARNLAKELYK